MSRLPSPEDLAKLVSYVFDVMLGWIYAITVFLVVGAVRRAWARRSERRSAERAVPEPV